MTDRANVRHDATMTEGSHPGAEENAAPANGAAADLLDRLRARITSEGPLTVGAYMADALYDPRDGYYATKDPIGAGGDFITAPEISQMFGELVGLWCLQSWLELGSPDAVRLIELGPGRGVMMADMLRAARVRPAFLDALRVTLVEASPALQAAQARALATAPFALDWAADLPAAGAEPALIVANEFVDCLPIRQFIHADGQWRERLVGLEPNGALAFVAAALPAADADVALIPDALRRGAPDGAIVEVRPATQALLERVASRLAAHGGRALFIDYGPLASEVGDTFQAVRGHQRSDPLATPGRADLTARVDFATFAAQARALGLETAGPLEQGAWLRALGLDQRAAALRRDDDAKGRIATQVFRLTDPSQMGALFKVLCVSTPGLAPPAGFGPARGAQ